MRLYRISLPWVENAVSLKTSADGSCLFHAIVQAYYKPYIEGKIDRYQFIQQFRSDLAEQLPDRYDTLGAGFFKTLNYPQYSLENMMIELKSGRAVEIEYIQLIADLINKDIYIISKKVNHDGGEPLMYEDNDILYRDRPSIVLLYIENDPKKTGHYETMGILNEDESVSTLFSPDHDFILRIRERMDRLKKCNISKE